MVSSTDATKNAMVRESSLWVAGDEHVLPSGAVSVLMAINPDGSLSVWADDVELPIETVTTGMFSAFYLKVGASPMSPGSPAGFVVKVNTSAEHLQGRFDFTAEDLCGTVINGDVTPPVEGIPVRVINRVASNVEKVGDTAVWTGVEPNAAGSGFEYTGPEETTLEALIDAMEQLRVDVLDAMGLTEGTSVFGTFTAECGEDDNGATIEAYPTMSIGAGTGSHVSEVTDPMELYDASVTSFTIGAGAFKVQTASNFTGYTVGTDYFRVRHGCTVIGTEGLEEGHVLIQLPTVDIELVVPVVETNWVEVNSFPWGGINGAKLYKTSTGEVVLVDGSKETEDGPVHNTALWVYDIASDSWEKRDLTGSGPAPSWDLSTTQRGDKLHVIGGGEHYEINLTTGTWLKLTDPPTDETSPFVFSDGTDIFFGGGYPLNRKLYKYSVSAETYELIGDGDVSDDNFVTFGDDRYSGGLSTISGGYVYVYGLAGQDMPEPVIYRSPVPYTGQQFEVVTDTWELNTFGSAMMISSDDNVYLQGGGPPFPSDDEDISDSLYGYSLTEAGAEWAVKDLGGPAVLGSAMIELPGTKDLLLVGGFIGMAGIGNQTDKVWIYRYPEDDGG